ncbi:MAG: hypothetical protein ISR61_05115 [Desulfobacteraceae bacterium]|uniref:Uncharacterized protein n=1 Tax=Candidatus Desulfacyla euxinica TaxID=2841693 RepID=A0A8J6N064_9DELT|nr:hypothetical protein [Candidatus Desulfacyla euxinica]MBL6978308.1 hypothetical protein [Desulfobacteraceae bacterium]
MTDPFTPRPLFRTIPHPRRACNNQIFLRKHQDYNKLPENSQKIHKKLNQPQRFGVETKKTVNRPGNIKKWDSVAWFEELEKRRGQEEAKIVRKMEQWATGGPFQFRWSSRRKDDRATFWMFLTSEPPCRLLGFRLDGKIEIRFGDLMKFRPFNEEGFRRSLTDRLNRIAGINLSEALKLTGYPSVPISAIKDEGDATSFFETIEWCIKEIKEAKID